MSLLRTSAMRAIRPGSLTAASVAPRLNQPSINGPMKNLIASNVLRFNSSSTQTPNSRPAPKEKEFNPKRDWDAKEITYKELKPKTENPTPNTYLVDVREPDEVMQGMIPSAVNLPLTILPEALGMSADHFKEKFGFEKPQYEQEVTFYCRSGKRSSSASDIAKRNGYTNILNYKGSWLDWTEKERKM